MDYKSPIQQNAILNMTPLIDIVFLLLVFFMLTAHFVEPKQLEIQLPTSSTGDDISELKTVQISIDKSGIYYINEEAVHENIIEDRLKTLHLQSPDLIVQFQADQQSRYDKVIYMIDIVRRAGITQLELMTEE
ncbi:ExbD/TolR family protein [Neptuniibacter caesariensis]|uniref:TonB system transport protein ExbD n=1 Tax=Neptuniibacter caesariensis TaxID=207954 RepID=A0A7U8C8K0_NEPCE|nr:biopolymer transporter ExbD [Neptuniibacter caesariensis]EAR61806.1 TonB system transport protein ExbD [Neptuniibacter caesariensis]